MNMSVYVLQRQAESDQGSGKLQESSDRGFWKLQDASVWVSLLKPGILLNSSGQGLV